MNVSKFIKTTYYDDKLLDRKDYERGRKLFLYEGSMAVGIFSLTSGAFLAGLASYMGATDEFNGIIGAIPVLAGVVQLFSCLVFEKLDRRKFLISILCLCYRVLLGLMFFIPFIIKGKSLRIITLAGIYGAAYLMASFISPPASNWIVSLIPDNMRGKYLARKDAYSLGFLTIITLIFGKLLDIFNQSNREALGFLVIGTLVIVMAIFNFCFLSSIKEPKVEKMANSLHLKDIFLQPVKDKKFKLVIILFVLWNIGLQIAGPFFSVYMVTRLKLSYIYIMLMGVISSVVRIFVVPYWGKLADSKSWIACTKYSIASLALCHFLWSFVNNSTLWFLVPILHVLGGIAWAGISISTFNIQFIFSPKEGRTMYLGVNAAYGGLVGFASTIVGSTILRILDGHRISIGTFSISNMQVLFLMSGLLIGVCALYIHVFIKENVK